MRTHSPDDPGSGGPQGGDDRALLASLVDELIPRAVRLLVRLGIPDMLDAGPCSVERLASRTGTHPVALRRLLRYLAARGVLTEMERGRFALAPLGRPLRSEAEGSLRPLLMWSSEPDVVGAWSDFQFSLETGRSAYEHQFGHGPFDQWGAGSEGRQAFDSLMVARSKELARPLARYNWSDVDVIVDVGGGSGTVLMSLLAGRTHMRGVLLERPEALDGARDAARMAGVESRCEVVSGDFFEGVPPGGDRYLIANVLHDWDDQKAREILHSCRRVMKPDARLLVVEAVLPSSPGFHPAHALDLVMLVIFGGRERTNEELDRLLTDGGFRMYGSQPLSRTYQLIEAAPA